ncbi:NFACT family protein, partial [[Eubacterium] siraeum]|nr:NFACT family protein [[Eubacterium] siraeum]
MKQRSRDLLKMLMNTYERIARKLELQKGELAQCGEREVFRVRGDVVSANIYRMEKGMTELTAE